MCPGHVDTAVLDVTRRSGCCESSGERAVEEIPTPGASGIVSLNGWGGADSA